MTTSVYADVVQRIFDEAAKRRTKAAALAAECKYADAAYWQAVAVGMEQVALWLRSGHLP